MPIIDPFTITENDTREFLVRTLRNSDGAVIDLTGASVQFHMTRGSTVKVNAAAVITNATGGIVEYRWAAGNTDTPGHYKGEFQVTLSDGTIISVPTGGIPIHVVQEQA